MCELGDYWHLSTIKAYLVEVDTHALELELRGTVVDTIAVEAVLARDGLPESSTNLVTLINVVSIPRMRR